MNKILTVEEAKDLGLYCEIYANGYKYLTNEHIWHFIRHGIDLLANFNANSCNNTFIDRDKLEFSNSSGEIITIMTMPLAE